MTQQSCRLYYSWTFVAFRFTALLYFLFLEWCVYEGGDWVMHLIIPFIVLPSLLTNCSNFADVIIYKKNEKFSKNEFTRTFCFLSIGLLIVWLLLFILVPLLDITDIEMYVPFIEIDTKVIFIMLATIEGFFVVLFDVISKRLYQRKCLE